jgi:replication factor C subunit 3/5
VIDSEKVQIDAPAKKALIELARGDMRKVLNLLQSCSMAFDAIDESKVYQCCGQPLKSDIKDVLNWLLRCSFDKAYSKIFVLQRDKGLALQDIITRVHLFVHKSKSPITLL